MHLISLFPESFSSYLNESIIARAIKKKVLSVYTYNPRDFAKVKGSQKGKAEPYLRVDDKPYGGGPGMVMEPMPIIRAVEKAIKKSKDDIFKIIFLSPGGAQFTNEMARSWVEQYEKKMKKGKIKMTVEESKGVKKGADKKGRVEALHIVCICGRYEGVDERVNQVFKTDKISVGPFVTTGGELPAMIIIDALARQIPGVLGNFESKEEARVASHEVYTRPEVLKYKGKKYRVPKVLLSGDHKKIEEWRGGKNNERYSQCNIYGLNVV
jgi:tRNA (guanine37-N1)-methyltransferase